MGDQVLALSGPPRDDGAISLRGSYAAPTGPDWGWRIEVMADGGRSLRIVHHNILPDGQEMLAVTSEYARAP